LFSLERLKTQVQLERVIALASHSNIEIETHPVNPEEYKVLADKDTLFLEGKLMIAHGYILQRWSGVRDARGSV
jgi:hypothetical protein